jgi:anti-sigma factor RsiW
MSNCLDRQTLQMFLDREISPSGMVSAEIHFASCDKCRTAFEDLRAVNLHTQSLLNSLLPEQMPEIMPAAVIKFAPKSAATRARFIAASIGALAACALLAFAIARHDSHPTNSVAAIPNSASASSATHQLAAIPPPAPEIAKHAPLADSGRALQARHRAPMHPVAPSKLDFIALDDDGPIESGMIVRMDLDATPKNSSAPHNARKIPVDVLVDQQGEVRAIRFLNGGAK